MFFPCHDEAFHNKPFVTLPVQIKRSASISGAPRVSEVTYWLITIVQLLVAALLAESITFPVKEKVPALVGLPVIAPVGASFSPSGSFPEEIEYVYGETPPDATKAEL